MNAEYKDIDSEIITIFLEEEEIFTMSERLTPFCARDIICALENAIDFTIYPDPDLPLGVPEMWGNDYGVYRFETWDSAYIITPEDIEKLNKRWILELEPTVRFWEE